VILAGKRLLITGVITKDSIAFHAAARAQQEGAAVLLTSFGRVRRLTERAASRLPDPVEVLELDVNDEHNLSGLTQSLRDRWEGLDGVLHAIAFAPEDALGGRFISAPADSALEAFRTSAFSLKALAQATMPLMSPGASIVGLDFDASVAWPIYDWMGVAKAALESIVRYLARDLGSRRIRVNSIAAGTGQTAVVTLASCKIKVSANYVGDTTGQFSDFATLAADLTVTGSSPPAPVPFRPVTLSLGTQSCTTTSGSTGRATCSVRIVQHSGPVSAGASFAGDPAYESASASGGFTITPENTATSYTGPTTSDYHDAFTASATLTDPDAGTPIPDHLQKSRTVAGPYAPRKRRSIVCFAVCSSGVGWGGSH